MLARLGDVLYWASLLITGIMLIVAAFNATYMLADAPEAASSTQHVIAALVVAAVIWLIGRACRYVLAGR